MSRKLKYDQYEILVAFKTDNVFSITAEFTPTDQLFSNNSVQLMRINKQTVIASLEKKSEKNLRCQFQQLFEDGKKWLQISFIVNFDFLPQFREEIRLEIVEQKEGLKRLNFTNMQAEIEEISKALDCIQENGSTICSQSTCSFNSSSKKQAFSKEVKEGKYILRFSGTAMNSPGMGQADKIMFKIIVPGQQDHKQLMFKVHHQASYYYPFSASEVIACSQGQLKVEVSTTMANANLMNLHFVMNRVVEVV